MNKQPGVEIRVDVPYGGGPQGNLCVDLYLPTSAGQHPALLCLHGGAWLRGSPGVAAAPCALAGLCRGPYAA